MKKNSKFQSASWRTNSKKNPNSNSLAGGQNSRLSRDQVKHIAKLARLSLTEEEVEKFQRQLSEVLEYMEVLNEVETEGVEPTAQVTGLENVFREDEVYPSLKPKQAISGASAREGNFFKTGVVLEK